MSLSTPFIHRPIATMLLTLGLALVGSDADSRYYQAGDSAGQRARRLGRSGVVLSLGRNF